MQQHYKYSVSFCAWKDYTLTPSNTLIILTPWKEIWCKQGDEGHRKIKNAARGDILIFFNIFSAFAWKTAS